jgi:hypothetical protein
LLEQICDHKPNVTDWVIVSVLFFHYNTCFHAIWPATKDSPKMIFSVFYWAFCKKRTFYWIFSTSSLVWKESVPKCLIIFEFTNSDLFMYLNCICHERKEHVPFTWRKCCSILQLKLRFSLKKMWSHVILQLQSNNKYSLNTCKNPSWWICV